MRVLVTGDREWDDELPIHAMLSGLWSEATRRGDLPFVVIEGGATGADAHAGRWARVRADRNAEVKHEKYPADWRRHKRAAGPIRNQQMLDTGIDLCVAFHDDLWGRAKGTKDMVERCRGAGVQTYVLARVVNPQEELPL